MIFNIILMIHLLVSFIILIAYLVRWNALRKLAKYTFLVQDKVFVDKMNILLKMIDENWIREKLGKDMEEVEFIPQEVDILINYDGPDNPMDLYSYTRNLMTFSLVVLLNTILEEFRDHYESFSSKSFLILSELSKYRFDSYLEKYKNQIDDSLNTIKDMIMEDDDSEDKDENDKKESELH